MHNLRYQVPGYAIFVCLFLCFYYVHPFLYYTPEKCGLIFVLPCRWHREICCRQEIEQKNWRDDAPT
jgi:hypothetical protein